MTPPASRLLTSLPGPPVPTRERDPPPCGQTLLMAARVEAEAARVRP
jgi:hypothetical protein